MDIIPIFSLLIVSHPFLFLIAFLSTVKNSLLSNIKSKITVTAQNTTKQSTPFFIHKISVGDPVVANADTIKQDTIIVTIERLSRFTIFKTGYGITYLLINRIYSTVGCPKSQFYDPIFTSDFRV